MRAALVFNRSRLLWLLDKLRNERPDVYAQLLARPFGIIPSHATEDSSAEWWGDQAADLADDIESELYGKA